MSQTKRKVKIRQHIAQLHIKTQAVNCPNFKRKKAEPSKCDYCPIDVEIRRNTHCCERCTDEHPAYDTKLLKEASETKTTGRSTEYCSKQFLRTCEYIRRLEAERQRRFEVSEAEHTKSMEEYGKQNEALAKVCGDLKEETVRLENENKNLRIDNQSLLEITQYNSDNLNTYAKWWDEEKQKRKVLEGKLEAIKEAVEFMVLGRIPEQEDTEYDEGYSKGYYDAKDQIKDRLREFGVLLSEPKTEKFRCDKFGDCNMSDACQQCPSNEECSRETRERGERMKRVKIFCHLCEGKGTIPEKAYPNGKEIQCVCPECNGEKWVRSDK